MSLISSKPLSLSLVESGPGEKKKSAESKAFIRCPGSAHLGRLRVRYKRIVMYRTRNDQAACILWLTVCSAVSDMLFQHIQTHCSWPGSEREVVVAVSIGMSCAGVLAALNAIEAVYLSYHSSPGKMAYRTVLAYSLAAFLLSDTLRNYPILPYLSSLIQRVSAEGMINSACCLPQSLVLLQRCHLPSLLFCALEKERCWVLQIPMAALADHVSTPAWWRQACWPCLRWLPSPSGDHTCMPLEANAKLLNLSLSILLLKEESSLKGNSSSQLLFGILFRGMG